MLDFFGSIMSYIEQIWDFFLNMINTLITFTTTVAGAVVLPPMLSRLMWAPIASCIVSLAAFALVKLLLGRGNV